jgi:hypothetical protein
MLPINYTFLNNKIVTTASIHGTDIFDETIPYKGPGGYSNLVHFWWFGLEFHDSGASSTEHDEEGS